MFIPYVVVTRFSWPSVAWCVHRILLYMYTRLQTGIVGLPNVGKSSLFNALCEIPDSELRPVVAYLQGKNRRLDTLSAMTQAQLNYRHDGTIRCRALSIPDQLRKWRCAIDLWRRTARQNAECGQRSIIRRKVGKLQGTIEQMECAVPCIRKG